jgi:hypothetical protein
MFRVGICLIRCKSILPESWERHTHRRPAAKVQEEGLVGTLRTLGFFRHQRPSPIYRRLDHGPINSLPKGHDRAPTLSRFMGYLLRFSPLPLNNGT